MDNRIIRFDGPKAQLQYRILMTLYRLVFNRWLYGIFCRNLARFFAAGNSVVLDLGQGRTYRVYLNDGYWTRFYLYHKSYEPEVQKALDAAAGHTPLFCDLGANAGLWSAYASTLFDQVIAVEASRQTFERLAETASDHAGVTARRAAIFSETGHVMNFVNVHNSHASAHLEQGGNAGAQDSLEDVETICIDDLVPDGTAALIKLDVEGAEIPAITGARRAIQDGSVLIYEDHGSDLGSEVSRHLLELGNMCLYSIETGGEMVTDLSQLQRLKTDRYKGYNFLAGRKDAPLLAQIVENFAKAG